VHEKTSAFIIYPYLYQSSPVLYDIDILPCDMVC
jgi:hypothetical protein